jgi:hypothetical protein
LRANAQTKTLTVPFSALGKAKTVSIIEDSRFGLKRSKEKTEFCAFEYKKAVIPT